MSRQCDRCPWAESDLSAVGVTGQLGIEAELGRPGKHVRVVRQEQRWLIRSPTAYCRTGPGRGFMGIVDSGYPQGCFTNVEAVAFIGQNANSEGAKELCPQGRRAARSARCGACSCLVRAQTEWVVLMITQNCVLAEWGFER